ncbi:rod-binding protein [Photobacterium swingsii]|uniref:rod-binding protein n=1 Tax=Photobacterium swingsii TaxID=680026 RepID=UPI003D0BDB78
MKVIDNEQHSALYNDMSELNKITANPDKKQALQQAANQFEAVFLQTVLRHMRKASESMNEGEDSPFNSKQQKFFREMYDSQIAVEMSQQQSMGISDMLIKQLGQHEAFKPQPQAVAVNQQTPIESLAGSFSPANDTRLQSGNQVKLPHWWGNTTPLSQHLKIQMDDEEL